MKDMNRIVALCVVALMSLMALPALAFTPDDEVLGDALRKAYGPLTSWEAEMTFPEYPGVSVDLWYNKGKWRQEWSAGDKAVGVGIGTNTVASCVAGDFALSPMVFWMPPSPLDSWKEWGVNFEVRNFGFCEDQPCFMIGAEPGDETMPTIYLNNEDHAPLLLRFVSTSGVTTVTYQNYRSFAGYRVPQKIQITVGEKSLECAVKWKVVKQAEDGALYARDGLDPTPCAQPPAPFDFLRDTFRAPSVQ